MIRVLDPDLSVELFTSRNIPRMENSNEGDRLPVQEPWASMENKGVW